MIVLALASIAVWAVIATIETVSRDGYRAVPFDANYNTRLEPVIPAASLRLRR